MALLLRAAATTVATLLLTSVPAGAHAGQWWGHDAAHDVTEWSFSPDPEPCGSLVERERPRESATDLLGLGVRHRAGTVELRARLRDASPWRGTALMFVLDTPGDSRRVHQVDVQPERPGGPLSATLFAYTYGEPDACGVVAGGGFGQPCDVAVAGPDARGTVTVVVPRTCLDRPRWVRVGASTLRDERGVLRGDRWGPGTDDVVGSYGPRVRHARG